jgi:hypothetical protein
MGFPWPPGAFVFESRVMVTVGAVKRNGEARLAENDLGHDFSRGVLIDSLALRPIDRGQAKLGGCDNL